jgi:hypothetical protein
MSATLQKIITSAAIIGVDGTPLAAKRISITLVGLNGKPTDVIDAFTHEHIFPIVKNFVTNAFGLLPDENDPAVLKLWPNSRGIKPTLYLVHVHSSGVEDKMVYITEGQTPLTWVELMANGVPLAAAPLTNAITESALSLSDVTTNDASIARHGFMPKLSGAVADFLSGAGTYASLLLTPISNLVQDALNLKASKSITINGYDLSANLMITSADVPYKALGTAASLDAAISDALSTGLIEGGVMTDNGGGNVGVSAAEVLIRSANSPVDPLYYALAPAIVSRGVPIDTERYVYVRYNAGVPEVTFEATELAELHTNVYLGCVHNVGGTLMIHPISRMSGDFDKRLQDWLSAVIGPRVTEGMIFFDPTPPSRKIAILAGEVWMQNFVAYSTPAFNSNAGGIFTNYYGALGVSMQLAQTDWDNTLWDNAGALSAMTNGYYSNRWVMINMSGAVGVVYGQAEYANQADAENELPPQRPPHQGFLEHGWYVTQITICKSNDSFSSVKKILPIVGGSSGGSGGGASPSDHEALTGLQGGTGGQHEHLTNAELALLQTIVAGGYLAPKGNGGQLTGMTAAQVGAYTSGQTDTLLAAKADLVGGLVPANQLPSYVDDVLEFANLAAFPSTGETGTIYIAQDTNLTYRWTGANYVALNRSLYEIKATATIISGVVTLDLAAADIFYIKLDANITMWALSNIPASPNAAGWTLKLIGDGTQRSIVYPAAWKPAGNTFPTPTATDGKIDTIVITTDNGGARFEYFNGGQNR